MKASPRSVLDPDLRRRGDPMRPTAIQFSETLQRPADPFPVFTDVREITWQTYTATPRGQDSLVVLRIIPNRHLADPRHQLRIESNLERAVYLREVGVAAVHSRGVAADGRSFLAREHVLGVPFDVFNRGEAFAMSAPPSLHDVVRLFAFVCRTIHRAHLKGVLHGGLKPGNVLVTDQGEARVVDFGLNLSPVHAAPDDVASLGRMLFDLLRERPLIPDAELTAIATRAVSLDERLGYANAGALADDLERYLAGRPLSIDAPLLLDIVTPWLERHLAAPSRVLIIGGLTGLLSGLLLAALSSSPRIAAITQSSGAILSGPVLPTWFIIVAAIWLTFGMFAERLGRARTAVGTLWAGGTVGLVAGIFAWATGAGGAIAAVINRAALAEAGRLGAVVDSPDRMAQLLAAPATSAAFAAAWLGPLVPLVLGVGFGVLGAGASRFVRLGFFPLPEAVLTYMELVVPAALGMLTMAMIAIGDAAGMVATQRVWFGPIGLFAIAALCWLAIGHGVPAVTRAAFYFALLALIARLIGSALPIWIEIPVYLISVGMIIVFVQSPPRGPRNVFE